MNVRNFCLLVSLLSIAPLMGSAKGQEHVPTVEACREDVATWARTMGLHGYSNMPYMEVVAREGEVLKCDGLDPDARFKSIYETHIRTTEIEIRWRLNDFITRHNLMQEFLLEDAQGKR